MTTPCEASRSFCARRMFGFWVSARLTASANEMGWVMKLLVTDAAEANEPGKPAAAQQKNQNTSIKLIRWRILVRCFGFCIRRAHKHKYASGASFAGPGQFGVQ